MNHQERTEKIISYRKETKAFEASIKDRPAQFPYTFRDGPPFASGDPHYGHLLASTIKDIIPRYKTMRGFQVHRKR